MLILTLRTDRPDTEIGLFEDGQQLAYEAWLAHRQLAETIHQKLQEILSGQKQSLNNIDGIVVYKGPGSFTGLRIGVSVANTLADSLEVPIIGMAGDKWLADGQTALQAGHNDQIVMPEYGAPPHTTQPKH